MDLYGHTEEEIKQQVAAEMMQSQAACWNKRSQFQIRQRLYNDQTKPLEKVTANVIYSQIRTLIWLGYNDDLDVKFVGRGFEDMSIADKRSKLAEFDYDEMNLEIWDYACILDKLMTWVGIKMFERYGDNNAPIICAPNSMNMLPDPKGWLTAENYRWVSFLNKVTKPEAKTLWFENIDDLVQKTTNTEKGDNNRYINIYQGADNTPDGQYDIVDHFFTSPKDGKRYLVTMSNQLTVFHRFVPVSELMGREVRPFSFFFFSPQRNNPYGISIPDLSEDKQRKISKLLNLAVARATRSSLWPDRLYAKDLIANRNDLVNLTPEPKLIGIDSKLGTIALQNAMMEVPVSQVPNDNGNTIETLTYFNNMATGIDPQSMGVQTPGSMTKAESQTLQANANLLFSLTNSINFWWEKDFWRKYAYITQTNFSGKKVIRITNQLGTQFLEIKAKELKSKEDLDVEIESQADYKAKSAQERVTFWAMLPYYVQQWWYAAKYALRKMSWLSDVDYDESFVLVEKSAAEEEANLNLEMLNRNIDLELPTDLMEEHNTYITIYRQAMDTPAKRKAINARTMMKIQKDKMMWQQAAGWMQWVQQAGQSVIWGTQNSMTNNALQSQGNTVSTQQVNQPQTA